MTFVRVTFTMFSSALIWAVHFLVIYSATAIACARNANDFVPWVIGIATFAAAFALVIVMRSGRKAEPFAAWMTMSLAALALVAVIWEASAVLIVPMCV